MSSDLDWRVGDRVFAAWEPCWLYPGTVLFLDEDVALVKFDDGDRALRHVSELRSMAIRPGDTIHCRRDRELKRYFAAHVAGVSDNGIRVRYAEDGANDLVPISFCRILCGPLPEELPEFPEAEGG